MAHNAAKTDPLRRLWRRLTRPERAVVALLAVFGARFLFSAAAQKLAFLRPLDAIGSGRHPLDVWLLLLCCTTVLGTACLYRRVWRVTGGLDRFQRAAVAVLSAGNAIFYLVRFWGRQTLYIWDYATYYNLQIRLEANFAESVFMGVGATVYKTWFNDYAPLVINTLTEPFFMFTDRTANTYAMLGAMLFPPLVYLSAALLLAVLARRFAPRAARLFFAVGLFVSAAMPLLHGALYRGMPDMLGVAFVLVLFALGCGYTFAVPSPARLVCMTAFTGMLMLTRRCYISTAAVYFLLYGGGVLLCALHRRRWPAVRRLLSFAALSLLTVGGALAPMFIHMARRNYAERYTNYWHGGLPVEIANQWQWLGPGMAVLCLFGIVYGLVRRKAPSARPLAILAGGGMLGTVWLLTRIQNLNLHQSLALVPFYLLAFYLCLLAVTELPVMPVCAGAAAALVLAAGYQFAVIGFAAPDSAVFSSVRLSAEGERSDLAGIRAVNDWLRRNCSGKSSAYMICHGNTYSPDVFREACLPDETIREILPYGAVDPGNDTFPTGIFTAQAVLTVTPFDGINHTGKINAAFRENLERFDAFEPAMSFDMGNGYTILAWRRVKPATRAEVEAYRAALAEEDEQWPYNFSAVFDAFLAQNGL